MNAILALYLNRFLFGPIQMRNELFGPIQMRNECSYHSDTSTIDSRARFNSQVAAVIWIICPSACYWKRC
ncbi:hypothetical protein RJT34_13106 [Clitoria ternatea]|uniref:Uncharacterized protein n=1 Tax=Clitoria ternatea TaxID=43366 RepID=A0AAN9PM05_CLITE